MSDEFTYDWEAIAKHYEREAARLKAILTANGISVPYGRKSEEKITTDQVIQLLTNDATKWETRFMNLFSGYINLQSDLARLEERSAVWKKTDAEQPPDSGIYLVASASFPGFGTIRAYYAKDREKWYKSEVSLDQIFPHMWLKIPPIPAELS
jgi:hypothetical protein